ncbi:DUF6427 family protein [Flavobacterium sp. TAB 87]|uniref:DUF6427 family protein n=1 Tax=Flavobacterium sp. TAB 87 TaxID=1729581 RepID=UPI00076C84D8|nr:DUF6427 family protein [Flavobacterium sp. TAB 87]KVV13454.1 hypothetical protein AP058_02818 [Flavobacterium sp. TAB 87]
MITSVFKKSTPLNYSLIIILMLLFFFIYQFQDLSWFGSAISIVEKVVLISVILASILVTNFITKKNGLSKDNTYVVFFYFLLFAFFPDSFSKSNIILANFFLLLALRRLISLQSLKSAKEKIFDASLWIIVASLFQFWCILFLVLVFISIIFHVAGDYRNWILPFIALLAVGTLFIAFALLFNIDILSHYQNRAHMDFSISYFAKSSQNWALSIYFTVALCFVFLMVTSLSKRPLLLHSSYKKVVAYFFIAILVYLVSPDKSNDLLVFTVAPLAIMATSQIEFVQQKITNELTFGALILCSLFVFFAQL